MFVRDRMTPNPITVSLDTTLPDALRLMRDRQIRHLPVVDKQGRLVGIVSDRDLLQASPSPATTLAVWEIPDLLARLKMEQVMTRPVITVPEDTPLEEAARVLADRRISGLPVMRGEALVGIITETDLFKTLLEMLGGRRAGTRLAVMASATPGTLARISSAISGAGGDIVGLGVSERPTGDDRRWEVVFKVQGVDRDALMAAVRPVVYDILDARDDSGA